MNPTDEPNLPPTCDVAFKEWAGVCRALADGRQSLILRKGGIEEDPGGFRPEHPAFWLYPTHLHEAQHGLRAEAASPPAVETPDGFIDLPALAVVAELAWVDRPEVLLELADLHVWTEETVLKRFHYKRPGLWVLGVRAFRADEPRRIAITPEHAGCKSWVPLASSLPTTGLVPSLGSSDFQALMDRVRSLPARRSS